MNPYLLLGLGIAWLVSLLSTYHFAVTNTENAYIAAAQVAQDQSIKAFNEQAKKDLARAVQIEAKRTKIRTVTQTITERIHEAPPVPVSCNLPDSLLQSVREALRAGQDASRESGSPESGKTPGTR